MIKTKFLSNNKICERVKKIVERASKNLKLAFALVKGRYFEEPLIVFKKYKEVGGKVYLLHANR